MNRPAVSRLGCLLFVILAIAALWRTAVVMLNTGGEGAYATSRDEMLYAEFSSNSGPKFFGGRDEWAEFSIRRVNGPVLWTHRIDGPASQMSIRDADAGVTWSDDSKTVTFSAQSHLGGQHRFTLRAVVEGSTVRVLEEGVHPVSE